MPTHYYKAYRKFIDMIKIYKLLSKYILQRKNYHKKILIYNNSNCLFKNKNSIKNFIGLN